MAHGFRPLFHLLRPHLGSVALVLGASAAASALALAQPWLAKRLIDDGLIARQMPVVAATCALILGAALLALGVGAFNRWHYLTLSGKVLFALRERVFGHLQRLPPTYFARRSTGEILSRIDGDVAEVQRFVVDTVLATVNAVLVLAGTLAVMAALAPQLLAPAFVLLPLQIVVARRLRPRMERLVRRLRERNGEMSGFLVHGLQSMKLIQAMGGEARDAARFSALNRHYLDDLRRAELFSAVAGGIPGLLNGLAAAAVFLAGGLLVMEGTVTVGALVAFTLYLGRAVGPVNTLLGLILAQRRARVSLDRVMEILDEPVAVENPPVPLALPATAAGAIRLDAVTFSYGGGGPVFSGLDAVIPAGAKVGLVGASGIGKSTLVDLLHRHYDPDRGRILLDGVDLRHLDLAELRRRIAVVAQDSPVVAGTIADNIRLAAPDADDRTVERAAALAEIGHLGLDTLVGERGATLSGGERQRLAIARALLLDPLVLVLDEAVSAVDLESGRRIARTIDTLFHHRTRIVISHHPDALAGAGLILELTPAGLRPHAAEAVA
ncbi:putative ABC transporter [Magnetospirillum sp. XM-1]|uniref:ABC transporter ATP-binding protein n=1 Tax=Magnetospirillum sp. XM-1 TaxID=1663591 RepID=UPI00073DF4EA|nr:ABC transporter ATP-binding protein [Magnetospirillum sp. XM-1]CUW39596.1 putative ABC transporter [Magnetospirillum sp. XM-1]